MRASSPVLLSSLAITLNGDNMEVVNKIAAWVKSGVVQVLDLLPDSPFSFEVPDVVHQYLGYLNYFVPVRLILGTLAAWTACIALWYAASVFMRWLRAIE